MKTERDQTVKAGLEGIKGMTLSVVDGNFPREVLANQNLTFAPYRMPARRNKAQFYDAKTLKPAGPQPGALYYGAVSLNEPQNGLNGLRNGKPAAKAHGLRRVGSALALAFCTCLFIGAVIGIRHGAGRKTIGLLLAGGLLLGLFGTAGQLAAQEKKSSAKEPSNLELIDQLGEPKTASAAADKLIARGKPVVPDLLGEALEGNNMVLRGWAIVCLSEIGGKDVEKRLTEMYQDKKQSMLVRTWAAAGLVQMSGTSDELLKLAALIPQFPALGRPIGLRLVSELGKKGNDVTAEELLTVTLRVQ
ncbi:MAG: HEAT repeat domain-containing protein, partial [Planctomycetes bacterium]|nr:HEAT repeat domain-containing protein [Planctomycetota bacterium]